MNNMNNIKKVRKRRKFLEIIELQLKLNFIWVYYQMILLFPWNHLKIILYNMLKIMINGQKQKINYYQRNSKNKFKN